MKPIAQKKSKKPYWILLHGKPVGKSWAVSPEKARTNFWWKYAKGSNEFSSRKYNPEDFDVVEV